MSSGIQCSPATAFANATAGDTVYFRSGTYYPAASTGNSPSIPAYSPANSGTAANPIIFQAYPGEAVTISAHASTQVNGQLMDDCFGVVSHDYIIFDGFNLVGNNGSYLGRAYMWHSTGSVFRNLTINGGATVQTSLDNCDCIRIEYCSNYAVRNCKIHSFHEATHHGNTAGIKLYHNKHSSGLLFGYPDVYGVGVLENLEIYDGDAAIFVKSSTDDLTIRNSFIHDSDVAILATPDDPGDGSDVMESDRGAVYNNLIVNSSALNYHQGFNSYNGNVPKHGNDWVLYNNTLYNTGQAFSFSPADSGHGWTFYNNISQNQSATYDFSGQNVDATCVSRIAAEDHNQWGTGAIGFEYGRNSGYHRYNSLAAWQATNWLDGGGSPGRGDLASDPLFANPSGTLTQKADFVLASNSPSRGTGRNGTDMGALNILTTVGYVAVSLDGPAAPKNVVVSVVKRP